MKDEIWKSVKGYEGIYQVSDLGRVRSLDRIGSDGNRYKGQILKPAPDKKGYLTVNLSSNNKRKTRTIHQLVAESFLSHKPCGYKLVVDHIDNNKVNNNLSNLQVITQRENVSKDFEGECNYTGVYLQTGGNKYVSKCWHNGKSVYIGQFKTEIEASKAYNNYLNSIK
jgi:hypothetical protein